MKFFQMVRQVRYGWYGGVFFLASAGWAVAAAAGEKPDGGVSGPSAVSQPGPATAPATQPAVQRSPLALRSRLGMNIGGPSDSSTEYPFVDVARLARTWISQRQGAKWGEGPKLELDQNGWIKKLEPNCWAETPLCTLGHNPPGEYVARYDGEGEIEFSNNVKVVTAQPGRITFTPDGKNSIFLRVKKTNPDNYVRNIRVLMPGHEATYQSEPFNPAFLSRWREFNTFRFMDFMLTNGSKVSAWEDRPTLETATFTWKGVPLEVMIDLCNRLKINPWFCMPHLATDDYVRHFAMMVKDKLDPSLKVYVEYSNEVWNGMFEQARYAQKKAQELGLGPKERPWEGGAMYYGQRSVEIFKIWEEVFGGKDRLVRVLAWQAGSGPYWTDGMLLAQKDTAQHVDALAIAPYITMCIPPKSNRPENLSAETVADWSLDQVFDHVEKKALPESIRWIEEQKKVADKYGLKLVAYEAGQHLVGVTGGENNEKMTKLFTSANRDPRMGKIYTEYLDAWKKAGGDLMCIFSSTGTWSKWGSWGLTEYLEETEADQPKYKAVLEWNRSNLRE